MLRSCWQLSGPWTIRPLTRHLNLPVQSGRCLAILLLLGNELKGEGCKLAAISLVELVHVLDPVETEGVAEEDWRVKGLRTIMCRAGDA